jgi:hypothetical protein
MIKPRTYTWPVDTHIGPLQVYAEVSGHDTGGSYENPPEYREVVYSVVDKDGEEVTDEFTEDEHAEFIDEALRLDDNALQAAYDRAHEYNHGE